VISTTQRIELPSIFFFQGKAPKDFHAFLIEINREHAPWHANAKNCVAQFIRGNFSTSVAPRPGRNKTLNIPRIIDQIHELILEYRRITSKSIAEKMNIPREWVVFIIHEDLGMQRLSAKWVYKYLNAD